MLNKLSMLLFCWQALFACYGQVSNRNYFYEKEQQQFVLSEKNKTTGSFDSLNSLFIWKKDTVYRIIFEYENKKGVKFSEYNRSCHFFSLLSFLNKAGHINLYDNLNELKDRYNQYNAYRLFGKKSDLVEFTKKEVDDGWAYTVKLKVLINNWNMKHNAMADRLASIIALDGNGEIMLKNAKRKSAYHNDFPLAFSLPGTDSLYFTRVYLINIYKASGNISSGLQSKYLKEYRLISSVNFDTGEFSSPSNSNQTSLRDKTLAYIFKSTFPGDTTQLFSRLSSFGLSKFNQEYEEDSNLERAKPIEIRPWNQSSYNKGDTLVPKKQLIIQNKNLQDENGLAEYCKECYDAAKSIVYRISNHCPVNIKTSADLQSQNWRYNFSEQGLHFFSVENPIRRFNEPSWTNNQEFEHLQSIWNWQLMSPGIGYWLSSSEIFGLKYKFSPTDYYINGRKIN
ncbi:hypothetical protein [Mucilaginibacter sp.]|uniref:hypothetical protein n=1 Tax=Mucilaginibacter sp. TaxID=1882438 RepID=UPI00260870F6|nr:hypothetical protein [Mucilaginibacter sp.]MDB4922069.1 hypothetical protein [Mucilaginibacter sp.]